MANDPNAFLPLINGNDNTGGYSSPQDLLAAQQAAWQSSQESPNATVRALGNIRYGITNGLLGGGPQVQKSQQIQTQLQSILSQVNDQLGPDADPLQRQLAMSTAMAKGMVGVSPQMAAMGASNAVKAQQAIDQQKYLGAHTGLEQAQTPYFAAQASKLQEENVLGKQVVIASASGRGPVLANLSMDDPNYAQELQKALLDAKQNGVNDAVPVSASTFFANRGQQAALRAQLAMQKMWLTHNAANAPDQKAYATDMAGYDTAATTADGLIGMLSDTTHSNPATVGMQLKSWAQNLGANIQSIVGGGNMDPDAYKAYSAEAKKNPEYAALTLQLTWGLVRTMLPGTRITQRELSWGKSMIDPEGNANPQVILQLLHDQLGQRMTDLSHYSIVHPTLFTDPYRGQMYAGGIDAMTNQYKTLNAKLEGVMKNYNMTPTKYGAGAAPAPASTAATPVGDGNSIPNVSTQAAYDALPKGARYMFNGQLRTKQ